MHNGRSRLVTVAGTYKPLTNERTGTHTRVCFLSQLRWAPSSMHLTRRCTANDVSAAFAQYLGDCCQVRAQINSNPKGLDASDSNRGVVLPHHCL